jgi:hypothetical protein
MEIKKIPNRILQDYLNMYDILMEKKMNDLRDICKKSSLKGYYNKKKNELC